jgi:hypothetical protein
MLPEEPSIVKGPQSRLDGGLYLSITSDMFRPGSEESSSPQQVTMLSAMLPQLRNASLYKDIIRVTTVTFMREPRDLDVQSCSVLLRKGPCTEPMEKGLLNLALTSTLDAGG